MIDLKKAKKRLIDHREELVRVADAAGASRKPVELDQTKVGRLSRMDALQDQAMALEVENRRQIELKRVDAALQRVADEDYGYCVVCGEDIEPKRLDLDPATPMCHACSQGGGR